MVRRTGSVPTGRSNTFHRHPCTQYTAISLTTAANTRYHGVFKIRGNSSSQFVWRRTITMQTIATVYPKTGINHRGKRRFGWTSLVVGLNP